MSDNAETMALLLESETEFGLSLLRQQNLNESLVFSPLSIALALSLVHVAAKGETKSQIRNVIAKGATDEQLEHHFSSISQALLSAEKGTQVNVANHVFARVDHPLKQEYLTAVEKLYKAGASSLDFGDKEATAKAINDFVKKNTGEQIKEIIKSDAVTGDLVAVLINALYFKANWQNKFKPEQTHDDDFFTSENDKRSIKFLNAKNVHRSFAENDDWQVLSLPYKDETFAFHVFLPNTRFGLQAALKTLDAKTIQFLIGNTTETFLNIQVPKMRIESSFGLREALQQLGIKDAFDKNADLSVMGDGLYVSKVSHKAVIDVDEDGTTAAAATAVTIMLKSAMIPMGEPREFRADHPFVFVLTKDNHPLFIGLHN